MNKNLRLNNTKYTNHHFVDDRVHTINHSDLLCNLVEEHKKP